MNGVYGKRELLRYLTVEEIAAIDRGAFAILARTGVLIENETLRGEFARRGATVDNHSGVVRIPEALIRSTIATAPRSFALYGRSAGAPLMIGDGATHTHNLGGPAFFRDLAAGARRPATRQDLADATRLVDAMSHIHACVPPVSPTDIPAPELLAAEMLNGTVRYTAKPLMCATDSAADVYHVHQIAMTVAGSEAALRDRPSLVVGLSPISPLYFNENICEAMIRAAQLGLPSSVLPAPMAGGTAPVTFAGALAQQQAELLAVLTVLQMLNPGHRVVFSPRLMGLDMRTGRASMGTCEFGMVSACAVQLGHLHGLPVDVFGLATDAIHMDEQAGYERALNGVLPCLAGADMLSGAGLIEAATGARLEQIVIDDEVFGMILRLRRGFEVNDDTLALDLIDQVGPKGNYLGEPHTARHIRGGRAAPDSA